MKAEVVPTLAGLPRVQAHIYNWLRRVPANADRLQVAMLGSPNMVILEMTVEEVVGLGLEAASERIYSQCDAVAMDNDGETRFAAHWFSGSDRVLYLPIRLGIKPDNATPYDGSVVSLLSQLQGHLENNNELVRRQAEMMMVIATAALEQQRDENGRLRDREVEVQEREQALREQMLGLAKRPEPNKLDQILDVAAQLMERAGMLAALQLPPKSHQH